MAVESTVPTSNDNRLDPGIIRVGSNRFQVNVSMDDVETIKQRCESQNLPLIEEYDFNADLESPNLRIELKTTTTVREYQEQSLSKMFSRGRARSGIIVLPCGAGKTLTGIAATAHIKKSTLVLCSSNTAVEQWYNQYLMWAHLYGSRLVQLTSKNETPMFDPSEAGIVISTYQMISYAGPRSASTDEKLKKIKQIQWGLMILDEVQMVPANTFRQVTTKITSNCKLGLTATLVKEDDKIIDLNFLIGPKLYEANWQDLC